MSDKIEEPVRLGILGTRRGIAFAESAEFLPHVEVVAFCGRNPKRMRLMSEQYPNVKLFTAYEAMLRDRQIDAVVVANYADEHAPAACQALSAGKHVLSEVPAFGTIAEGVELARMVESTGKVYMFGENVCYMAFAQEMRRLYEAGELGELRYAEGEYVHFARDVRHQLVDLDIPHHWRFWIPPTFYITHSIGPILRITGLRPIAVQAATGLLGLNKKDAVPVQSPAIELVRLENGAIVKSLHGGAYPREPWQPWFLVAGSKGCIENNRWPDPNEVTLYLDGDAKPRHYSTKFQRLQKEAETTQHWGADIFVLDEFVQAVLTGKAPDIDVYMALDMTLCGNLGWRSVLEGGRWMDIPDFRDEVVRKTWENDRYSCNPNTPKEYLLPNHAYSRKTSLPSEAAIETIRRRQETEPYYKAMYRD